MDDKHPLPHSNSGNGYLSLPLIREIITILSLDDPLHNPQAKTPQDSEI